MTTIAYLGPAGTYSEMAALRYLQLCHPDLEHDPSRMCPYPTIPQAINAAERGDVDIAVVPVENSIQGGVTMTLDSLWQSEALQIQQAIVLPIAHALITRAQNLQDIKVVYSHPQGLAQCQQWLDLNLPTAQQIATDSTADGVHLAATDPTMAAIASQRAAEIYNLPVLEYPINDQPDNCTRFLVLGRTAPTTQGTHSSLAFSLKRNMPGALVKPLFVFANRQINMSRIESRPTKRSLGEYIFFIDIEASMADPNLSEALQELRTVTEDLKILGSYSIL
ncbi:prephenate dehydratase [Pseudanabaena mucicola]|uniref:Prephenate dehydratase n=1 Tax=Pseudanabaena mucicola FACHB-723 TaxID=2692860 RepID=A0ABR7ZY78_9CYAN|nr:prephenate dehydratase [Pseudanabaena mucicola]MBD2188931.1 prephenate dehydratase [Pseudanabaena mucicola FACHB-723]